MKLKWKVGVSDGKNYIEGNPPFEEIRNELSPWRKLLQYLKENNLKITSMCITDGKRTFNLPSAGKNPKFRAFDLAEKPIDYKFFRMVAGDNGVIDSRFAVVEAIYKSYSLQLWVDERNALNCWVLVK